VDTLARGDLFAVDCGRRTVPIWDLRTGDLVSVLRGHDDLANGAVFGPDPTVVVTSAMDGTVRTWDVVSGDLVDTAVVGDVPLGVGVAGGRWVAAVARTDGEVVLWWEGEPVPRHHLVGHREPVSSVTFGAGRVVTASHLEGAARVWDLASGEPVVTVTGHGSPLRQAVLDPTGGELATVGDDGIVRSWAVPSGDARLALHGHVAIATSAAYSPDGRLLATTSPDGTVALRLRSIDDLVEVATLRLADARRT
jgi:WD40 repeat protein